MGEERDWPKGEGPAIAGSTRPDTLKASGLDAQKPQQAVARQDQDQSFVRSVKNSAS
jgi:hypothetical protein